MWWHRVRSQLGTSGNFAEEFLLLPSQGARNKRKFPHFTALCQKGMWIQKYLPQCPGEKVLSTKNAAPPLMGKNSTSVHKVPGKDIHYAFENAAYLRTPQKAMAGEKNVPKKGHFFLSVHKDLFFGRQSPSEAAPWR